MGYTGNVIHVFPFNMCNVLNNLSSPHHSEDPLTKTPCKCFCLRHLHLSDNLLEQLPAGALQTAPRLELLSLHGNPWTCDCQLHWLMEWSSTHEGMKA